MINYEGCSKCTDLIESKCAKIRSFCKEMLSDAVLRSAPDFGKQIMVDSLTQQASVTIQSFGCEYSAELIKDQLKSNVL